VRHADLLAAYADSALDDEREAYLSHFSFGPEMQAHFAANGQSVAGFAGPCRCRWLVLDIDRADLCDALRDARRLVTTLHLRYPETEGAVPIYYSGSKGFHVLVELAHSPPPALGFNGVCRAFAEALAARAGVKIDAGIYDVNHLVRLPNTKHPRTGLFKRRVEGEALFLLDVPGILETAKHPAGDGMPSAGSCPAKLEEDWHEAEQTAARATEARAARRGACAFTLDARAPRYLVDFLRFGTEEGERHRTLFRCAAWLTEQGAPSSLCSALLTEPGEDVGLTPKDVARQIQCGIDHARGQCGGTPDPDACERRAIRQEGDPLPPCASRFPFGALAGEKGEGGPE
jgi:hypothetical protein